MEKRLVTIRSAVAEVYPGNAARGLWSGGFRMQPPSAAGWVGADSI